jgi:adenine phosphoribosyltransferase
MALADDLVDAFRWVEGHADMSSWFADAGMFGAIVAALAEPFHDDGVTQIVGIESRGFLLSGAVARELGAGVVPIRKRGALIAGPTLSRTTAPDYRNRSIELLLPRGILSAADRVLIVDDWVETGSQMRTAIELVEEMGADLAGIAVVVDDSSRANPGLRRFHSIISSETLGSSS